MESDTLPQFPALETAISLERFNRYLEWAKGDRGRAVELYAINTAVSEALYTPMQMLEVALRNRCHTVLSERFGSYWYDQHGVLTALHQIRQIKDAKLDLVVSLSRGDRVTEAVAQKLTPGRIVASLTFGFWTSLFNTEYENTLWRQCLHKVPTVPPAKMKRKALSRELTPVRLLRNRVAHHEPIIYHDLAKRHERIIEITGWLLPVAAEWTRKHSRFPEIYARHEAAIVEARQVYLEQKQQGSAQEDA